MRTWEQGRVVWVSQPPDIPEQRLAIHKVCNLQEAAQYQPKSAIHFLLAGLLMPHWTVLFIGPIEQFNKKGQRAGFPLFYDPENDKAFDILDLREITLR